MRTECGFGTDLSTSDSCSPCGRVYLHMALIGILGLQSLFFNSVWKHPPSLAKVYWMCGINSSDMFWLARNWQISLKKSRPGYFGHWWWIEFVILENHTKIPKTILKFSEIFSYDPLSWNSSHTCNSLPFTHHNLRLRYQVDKSHPGLVSTEVFGFTGSLGIGHFFR